MNQPDPDVNQSESKHTQQMTGIRARAIRARAIRGIQSEQSEREREINTNQSARAIDREPVEHLNQSESNHTQMT